MPNLSLKGLDQSALSPTVKQRYLSQLRNEQIIYYYIMLAFGSMFVLIGAII